MFLDHNVVTMNVGVIVRAIFASVGLGLLKKTPEANAGRGVLPEFVKTTSAHKLCTRPVQGP
jgi:hypothetical protein